MIGAYMIIVIIVNIAFLLLIKIKYALIAIRYLYVQNLNTRSTILDDNNQM